MTNSLDANGLSIDSLNDIIAKFVAGYQAIYGSDLNLDSNTQDGQIINIESQQAADGLELSVSIYNNFDPDTCVGIQQDRLYYINGLIRKGATFTLQDITITVNGALTLTGLDAAANDPDGTGYTVADNLGNNWILLDTQNPASAGDYTYSFRAQTLGSVSSAPNTIRVPVSVVLGVTAINNATGANSLGQNGETDAAFRLRRSQSFASRATSSVDGLFADLNNIAGVVEAVVYENDTNITDDNEIPAHSIWVIVEGGADSDIAQAIYTDKTAGAGMKGSTTYDITTIQNQTFTAQFDRPNSTDLYLQFNLKPTKLGQTIDETAIKNYIATNSSYGIGEFADTANLTYLAVLGIASVGAQAVPLEVQISNNGTDWTDFLDTATIQDQWVLSADNITITDV